MEREKRARPDLRHKPAFQFGGNYPPTSKNWTSKQQPLNGSIALILPYAETRAQGDSGLGARVPEEA